MKADHEAATERALWYRVNCEMYSSDRNLAAAYLELDAKLKAAEAEIKIDDALLKERNRVLSAIPPCEAHGDQCIPNALDWIAAAEKDAERYRWLRDSPNAYPLFFIAQRDPINVVVQFKGELADMNIDDAIDAAIAQEKKP